MCADKQENFMRVLLILKTTVNMTSSSIVLLITYMMYKLHNSFVLIQSKMELQTEELKAKERTKKLMKVTAWVALAMNLLVSAAMYAASWRQVYHKSIWAYVLLSLRIVVLSSIYINFFYVMRHLWCELKNFSQVDLKEEIRLIRRIRWTIGILFTANTITSVINLIFYAVILQKEDTKCEIKIYRELAVLIPLRIGYHNTPVIFIMVMHYFNYRGG